MKQDLQENPVNSVSFIVILSLNAKSWVKISQFSQSFQKKEKIENKNKKTKLNFDNAI